MTLGEWLASDTTGATIAASVATIAAVGLYLALTLGRGRAASDGFTQHTNVHGSARPASQAEALKAARGDREASPLHDQTFEK